MLNLLYPEHGCQRYKDTWFKHEIVKFFIEPEWVYFYGIAIEFNKDY